MKTKPWYKSRIIWVGVLSVAAAVIGAIDSGVSWEQVTLAGIGSALLFLRPNTESKLTK